MATAGGGGRSPVPPACCGSRVPPPFLWAPCQSKLVPPWGAPAILGSQCLGPM